MDENMSTLASASASDEKQAAGISALRIRGVTVGRGASGGTLRIDRRVAP